MLNDSFKNMDRASKENRMRNIIASKARGISEDHIDKIMAAINIEKQYTVTGTMSYKSFLRNAYEEDGGEKFQVNVEIVYGSLVPGFVKGGEITSDPIAEDKPAAFMKSTMITLDGESFRQDSLFIYQNRFLQDAPGSTH